MTTSSPTRWLAVAALFLAAGLAPRVATADPIALLLWLAVAAPALGVLAGGTDLPGWPWSAAIPAGWMLGFALCAATSRRVVPTPVWPALVWTGTFFAGWALGRARGSASVRNAAVVAIAALVLCALPVGAGLVDAPFTPEATARMLDLAPTSWLVESAGVDWMRHPSVYEPAHAFDVGPELRSSFRGALAGPLAVLVGCALAFAAARARAGRRTA